MLLAFGRNPCVSSLDALVPCHRGCIEIRDRDDADLLACRALVFPAAVDPIEHLHVDALEIPTVPGLRVRKAVRPRPQLARPALESQHEPSGVDFRSEEHTSELQSLMRISYAVFCLKKKKK